MFTITIHLQSDDLALLEPLAKHLGHIEVAIDSPTDHWQLNDSEPKRVPHPAVELIDAADREEAHLRRQRATAPKLTHDARRKQAERQIARLVSPKVIDAVACPTCHSGIGRPCVGPSGTEFGRTGHTHIARREAYANQKETQS